MWNLFCWYWQRVNVHVVLHVRGVVWRVQSHNNSLLVTTAVIVCAVNALYSSPVPPQAYHPRMTPALTRTRKKVIKSKAFSYILLVLIFTAAFQLCDNIMMCTFLCFICVQIFSCCRCFYITPIVLCIRYWKHVGLWILKTYTCHVNNTMSLPVGLL